MGWNPIGDMKKLFKKFQNTVRDGQNLIKKTTQTGLKEIDDSYKTLEVTWSGTMGKPEQVWKIPLKKVSQDSETLKMR